MCIYNMRQSLQSSWEDGEHKKGSPWLPHLMP